MSYLRRLTLEELLELRRQKEVELDGAIGSDDPLHVKEVEIELGDIDDVLEAGVY